LAAFCFRTTGRPEASQKKNVVILTDVLDHTALASGVMLSTLREHIENMPDVRQIDFVCDCGPHFRTYEMLGYLQKEWLELNPLLTIVFSLFGAHHGTLYANAFLSHAHFLPIPRIMGAGVFRPPLDFRTHPAYSEKESVHSSRKGMVDVLFAIVRRWTKSALLQPGLLVKTVCRLILLVGFPMDPCELVGCIGIHLPVK
jgi:hypothetical protein